MCSPSERTLSGCGFLGSRDVDVSWKTCHGWFLTTPVLHMLVYMNSERKIFATCVNY